MPPLRDVPLPSWPGPSFRTLASKRRLAWASGLGARAALGLRDRPGITSCGIASASTMASGRRPASRPGWPGRPVRRAT
eukprot:12529741-Alexandrium_andersonii.AAC.1